MEQLSCKTVLLLDHSHWMKEPSGVQVEIEWVLQGQGQGSSQGQGQGRHGRGTSYYPPSFIPPVTKSLWTCGVESILEYSRVVLDLFANERLLRYGVIEGQGQKEKVVWINGNWDVHGGNGNGDQGQSIPWIAEKFGSIGPPSPPMGHSKSSSGGSMSLLQNGIKAGIEALGEQTLGQIKFMQGQGHGKGQGQLKAINKGRIILITTLHPASVGGGGKMDPEEYFVSALERYNRTLVAGSDHLLPILECEFVLISLHPLGKGKFSVISQRDGQEVPSMPTVRVESYVEDGLSIVQRMLDLCVIHHDLVSTTVTGIPMKEEQNAQHSSNYDVKLWHSRFPTSASEHQVLKWSQPLTPKGPGLNIQHCTSAVRITPVDITGRPTTCLTSFLMNGRSVWLEQGAAKKGGGKGTSHLLTSHGGEIWLHVIETARNVLEDPPSISEGVGGRVTDYRIPDFADLIRMNVLGPWPKNYWDHVSSGKKSEIRDSGSPFISSRRRGSADDVKKPMELAKERLMKKTGFWPMTIGGSVLFPMTVHIESILKLMPQDKLSDLDKVECDKCIWSLMSIEARGEPPSSSGHHKKQKREEQWRSVYNELEAFLRANLHSENHKKVLECFLESRRADSKVDSRSGNKTQDMEKALANLANFGTSAIATPTPSSVDSPMSPPPSETARIIRTGNGNGSSLLSLWNKKTEKKNLRVLSNPTLYSHLTVNKTQTLNNNGDTEGTNGVKKTDVKP